MRHLIKVVVLLLWLGALDSPVAHAQSNPPLLVLTPTTKLTPFKIAKGDVIKQKSLKRQNVVKSGRFVVAVVASWCAYSQEMLHDIISKKMPAPDLIIFSDDEVTGRAEQAIKDSNDKITRDKVRRWLDLRRQADDLLEQPEKIEYNLQYYLISAKAFDSIDHFPTLLTCNDADCKEMSRSERLSWLLKAMP
jgi:hypothetical protein